MTKRRRTKMTSHPPEDGAVDELRKLIPSQNRYNMAAHALECHENGSPNGRVLYKYQRISGNSLGALSRGYLYFSKYAQLNDPFDPFLTIALKRDDLNRMCNLAKILCMTEVENSPLMWAHYADCWRGMQVAFATLARGVFSPVKYTSQFLNQSFAPMDLLRLKSRAWDYEKEWRAVHFGDGQRVKHFAYPVAITLGPRAGHERMLRVRKALPRTVKTFEVVYPYIADGGIGLQAYSVDDVVNEYGTLPVVDELYWKSNPFGNSVRAFDAHESEILANMGLRST
jgi:hypothetical protein